MIFGRPELNLNDVINAWNGCGNRPVFPTWFGQNRWSRFLSGKVLRRPFNVQPTVSDDVFAGPSGAFEIF
jgi:hypothetical protein